MELRDRAAVVTGGASGIGRAMARRFAEEGARGVTVADLDGTGAEAVAAEIGDRARAVQADVARQDDIDRVIAAAKEAFGPIDLFCANAGVGVGTDLDTPDEVWGLAFDVNVRAHVRAARRLVPEWVERGDGYFLATASAAGLLTQIGSAPYAVTKHAAVGLAEWLSITHGDQGIKVSVLCPQAVRTAMTAGNPDGVASVDGMIEPEDVAEACVRAIEAETFLVLPHPIVLEYMRRKTGDYDRWIRGMRRLQERFGGPP